MLLAISAAAAAAAAAEVPEPIFDTSFNVLWEKWPLLHINHKKDHTQGYVCGVREKEKDTK